MTEEELTGGSGTPRRRMPPWLKIKVPLGASYSRVNGVLRQHALNTVCEDARCPNVNECWNRGTATFMILGDTCTRSCGFCAVKTGRPAPPDLDEPRRVAEAVRELGLKHAVVTSVNRDELPDGGASAFAETIRLIRETSPVCTVEVLIPDFQGKEEQLRLVIDARPDVRNHNVETVPRLYPKVRPQARYERSLNVLSCAREAGLVSKTGFMAGLGETDDEIILMLKDLRRIGVDMVTIGQYLQPTRMHAPVARYVTPSEFEIWKTIGLELGFKRVESGPLVRSSYHAETLTS